MAEGLVRRWTAVEIERNEVRFLLTSRFGPEIANIAMTELGLNDPPGEDQ